jgi:hypothetical protein
MKRHSRSGKIGHGLNTRPVRKTTQRRKAPRKRRGRSKRYQASSPASIAIKDGAIVMRLPRRLRSYNQRGGHWSEYSDRQAWAKLLREAVFTTDGSVSVPAVTRMRLDLIRLAPSKRYLLDKDNLSISGKRLTDALVEAGYLIDDDRKNLDGAYVAQGLSRDKCYWTIVQLKETQPYVDDVKTIDPMRWPMVDLQNVQELAGPVVESADEPTTSDPGASRRRALLRRGPRGHVGLFASAKRSEIRDLAPQLRRRRPGLDSRSATTVTQRATSRRTGR